MRHWVLPVVLAAGLGRNARAADHWGFTVAGALTSPTLLSHTPDRKFIFAGATYAHELSVRSAGTTEYTCEIIPFLLQFEPREEGFYYFKRGGVFRDINQGPAAIYAAGASPVGFRFTARPDWKVSPYASTSGGFLLSAKPIPYQVEDGTQFNFTFHFGAGLRIRTAALGDVRVGYRWMHISNAYRTSVNPGIDANVFELGFSFT